MPVQTAFILAAGLGTRLKPLTLERPKPLVEVGAVPLVDFAIAYARQVGAEQIFLNTHHLHPMLAEAKAGEPDLRFSYEPEVLGTGGGLRLMWERAGRPRGTSLILNADALIDVDLPAMLAQHEARAPLATLAVKDTPDKAKFGLLGSDADERILGFAGRTQHAGPFAHERMFCGVHLVEAALFERLPASFSCVNTIGYPPAIDAGEAVFAFDLGPEAYFCDVGTPERLLEANRAVFGGLSHLPAELAARITRVHPSAEIHPEARLEGCVVGAGARVGAGAELEGVCVQSGSEIVAGTRLAQAVVYPGGAIETAAVPL